jgi:acyl-CoA reductase-like NAD-dependent aldehyde dehydrogenase
LHARACDLAPQSLAFIDGKFRSALSGRTFDTLSPINGKVIAAIAACETVDVDLAVAAARRSFEDGPLVRGRSQSPEEGARKARGAYELARRGAGSA